jgi:SNF2 family DNA or RNA helicase
MMAVHTSNVDALPHQITAVYESMLPRQPLRFVLADDPGAGKTLMAGLYISELIMRVDTRRILVVAPGSLVELTFLKNSVLSSPFTHRYWSRLAE